MLIEAAVGLHGTYSIRIHPYSTGENSQATYRFLNISRGKSEIGAASY